MRASNIHIATQKETPADAEIISHQLMLRAGLIRKLASGLYSWLPLGLRILRKVEHIVRDEMNKAGAQELLMPTVQPAELWKETGRWEKYGAELLRLKDRHNREFCFGPTHEEVITDLIRNEISSYKKLPANFYQIQTKFRDERRPRFGIMRAREFLMKDAYSFHASEASLDDTYQIMHNAYCKIFSRIGLNFRPVQADSGSIGGQSSHEFHVLADSGEDAIAFSNESDYAANIELAPVVVNKTTADAASQDMQMVETPNQHSIEDVSNFLNIPSRQCLKTLLVLDNDDDIIAFVLRGDHELNNIKAEKIEGVQSPLCLASAEKIKKKINCAPGSIGPIGLSDLGIPVYVDQSAATVADFVCGANEDGKHLSGVNWGRDLTAPEKLVDIRNIVEGDPSPDGKGTIQIKRGIEVGHIFQLGKTYSEKMNASVLDENGKSVIMSMGCYGIGVSRVVAATIEQNNDDKGIIWPIAVAPFQLVIIPMNIHKSETVKQKSEEIYTTLLDMGYDVLLDDRGERAGVMFADMELIGIPHRIVIGEKSLKNDKIEYKSRKDTDSELVDATSIISFLDDKLSS